MHIALWLVRTCHTQSSERNGALVGAKASQHFSMCSVRQATQQIIAVLRVAHSIFALHHACACRPHIHAYLLPSSSLGPHSRRPSLASAVQHVTTCRAYGSGALRRPAFSFLDCSVPPWRPFYLGQLEPWSARTHHLPLRRLAPVCRSVGLSPTLSLPFSLAFPCSFSPVAPLCSFPPVLYPLSLSLCFSLPLFRAQKRGSGLLGASLSPPGFEPSSTGQKRCGVSTEPRRRVVCTMAPWHHGTMRSTLLLLFVTPCHAYLLSHGGVFSSV